MSRASTPRRRSATRSRSARAAPVRVASALIAAACTEAAAPPSVEPPPVARLQLSVDSAVLMERETLQLSVAVIDSAGEPLVDRDVLLYSMNATVATVTAGGLVAARSIGTALIVARAEGVRDTAHIEVQALFRAVSAGAAHTCGTSTTGRTYCWGAGAMGRLGSGSDRSTSAPVLVEAPNVFSSLSAGGESTCGLAEFTAFCWGSNGARQLGTGGKHDSWVPAIVAGQHRFRTLRLGTVHACGITDSDVTLCWGADWAGQIGNGPRPRTFVPDTVEGGLTFAVVAPGWTFTCAATTEGVPYCWGFNERRQLGVAAADEACQTLSGEPRPCSTDPLAVATERRFTSIVAGTGHACGLTGAGAAYCWGENTSGQRGDGTTDTASYPTASIGGLRFVALTAGNRHTCGLTAEGAAYCWGANDWGALGTTDTGERCAGAPCSTTPIRAADLLRFRVVSASQGPSGSHTCGVTPSGHAYCWGRNTSGQLGAGTASAGGFRAALVRGQPPP